MGERSAVTIDDIRTAAAGLGDRVHLTPVLGSSTLDELTGGRVVLKAELFQRTGSFKVRGAFNRVDALTPSERREPCASHRVRLCVRGYRLPGPHVEVGQPAQGGGDPRLRR